MPCDVTPGCSSSGALLVGELRRCAARQATVLCNDTHLPHPVHSGEGIVGRGKRAFCAVCGTRLCFALLRRGLFRGGARRKLVSIARGRVPEDRPLCSGWPLRRSSLSKERRGWPAEPGHAHNVYCAVGKRAPARVTTRPSADGTAHGSVSGALPFLLEPRLASETVAPPPPQTDERGAFYRGRCPRLTLLPNCPRSTQIFWPQTGVRGRAALFGLNPAMQNKV